MKSIALTVPVRKASQRVPNKMLRPFAGSSLFEIYLNKLEGFKEIVKIVAYEEEFIDIAIRRGFQYIRRDYESAMGETSPVIHNYLKNMDEEFIFMVTACCPFMQIETLNKAFKVLEKNYDDPQFHGMISVRSCSNIIWDNHGNVLNKDAHVFNTKLREPFYIDTSSIFVFRRRKFIDNGVYWNFVPRDPAFFEIDSMEAFDIDTLSDFKIAEKLYIEKMK